MLTPLERRAYTRPPQPDIADPCPKCGAELRTHYDERSCLRCGWADYEFVPPKPPKRGKFNVRVLDPPWEIAEEPVEIVGDPDREKGRCAWPNCNREAGPSGVCNRT